MTTLWVGLAVAATIGLPVLLWRLLVRVQQGRAAQARLAATEERLRFARDVHDLLGADSPPGHRAKRGLTRATAAAYATGWPTFRHFAGTLILEPTLVDPEPGPDGG